MHLGETHRLRCSNTLSGTIANTPGITANLPRKIEDGDDSAKLRVEDIAQWAQRGLPAAAMHLVVIGSVEVEGTSSPMEGAEVWHLRTKPSAFGPPTYEAPKLRRADAHKEWHAMVAWPDIARDQWPKCAPLCGLLDFVDRTKRLVRKPVANIFWQRNWAQKR